MKNPFSTILEFIFTPLIFLSSIFESILLENEKSNSEHKYLLRNIIQIIYGLITSIPLGVVFSIMIMSLLASRYSLLETGIYNISIISIILSIVFVWICFLNYNNNDFNMPRTMLSICWFLINMKWKFILAEAAVNIFLFPLVLIVLFIKYLSIFDISYNEAKIFAIVIAIFYFLTSLIVYSETTKDEVKRLARQCVMWTILFIFVTIFTVYQIYIYISNNQSTDTIISILLAVLGLAFTMTTIVDKTKGFYYKSIHINEDEIEEKINFFVSKYNIKKYIKKLHEEKKEVIENLKFIVESWKKGNKVLVIKVLIGCFLIIFTYIILIIYQNNINKYMDNIGEYIDNVSLGLFSGNEWLRNRVIVLLILLATNVKFTFDLYRKFKSSNIIDRIVYFNRVIFSASIFIKILGMTFFKWSTLVYTLLNTIVISQILVFWFTEKLKKYSKDKK